MLDTLPGNFASEGFAGPHTFKPRVQQQERAFSAVTGEVEFMLGNVGRDAGTLLFKGKFETADLITGEVEFSPLVGERASKHGTFKALRASGG